MFTSVGRYVEMMQRLDLVERFVSTQEFNATWVDWGRDFALLIYPHEGHELYTVVHAARARHFGSFIQAVDFLGEIIEGYGL